MYASFVCPSNYYVHFFVFQKDDFLVTGNIETSWEKIWNNVFAITGQHSLGRPHILFKNVFLVVSKILRVAIFQSTTIHFLFKFEVIM